MHVHLREPGFSYKETIASGTAAAAAGGYTAVCAMPNLKPVPDTPETLDAGFAPSQKALRSMCYPYGAITRGQQGGACGPGRHGPPCGRLLRRRAGRSVQEQMRRAMALAKSLDKPIVAHCEDEALLAPAGASTTGPLPAPTASRATRAESEWRQVERDLRLVRETGCHYHVCHISSKESVALIRAAKAEGLPVTCETGPPYLLLCDEDLQDDGRFRMNPPSAPPPTGRRLLEGLLDGTIDCIATDHAPPLRPGKGRRAPGSLNGIVGLECAFPVLYTQLVRTGIVPLEVLLNALCVNPRRIFAPRAAERWPRRARRSHRAGPEPAPPHRQRRLPDLWDGPPLRRLGRLRRRRHDPLPRRDRLLPNLPEREEL